MMSDNEHQSLFCTYVIDAWHEVAEKDQSPQWRFRIRDIRQNKQVTFSTVQAMMDYLSSRFESDYKND